MTRTTVSGRFYFAWDADKLERDEYEFGGIEVPDIAHLTEDWLAELDKLDLPRVDVPEAGLRDVTISDVLRWARKTYASRYTGVRV